MLMEKEVKLSRFSRDTLYIRDPEHPTRKLENNQWFQWEGTKSIHPQETHWERDRGHAPIYSSIKDNTIPWNKPNPGGERWKLQTSERRDWERHWKMERHPNFMNWQHLYCENDHPTKRFNAIKTKIPTTFFTELEKKIKTMERERPQIANAILNKKNGTKWTATPDFKIYYRATLINTICYQRKTRLHRPAEWNMRRLKHEYS